MYTSLTFHWHARTCTQTEKKLRHTERELMATKAVEQAAWEATQKSRNSIIEGLQLYVCMSACLRDLYTVLLPAVLYAARTCMRDV